MAQTGNSLALCLIAGFEVWLRNAPNLEAPVQAERHCDTVGEMGELFLQLTCEEADSSSSFGRGLSDGTGKLVLARKVPNTI